MSVKKLRLWNSDTEYALGLYRKLTRLLGIWPLERHKRRAIFQVTVASVVQLSVVITFVKSLVTIGNCSVLTDIVDALSLIATSILSVMKLILPHIYQESMYLIVSSAVEDWSALGDDKCRKTMLSYAYTGRIVFIVQMCGAYSTIIPLIFGNLPSIYVAEYEVGMNASVSFRNIPIGPNCWVPPTMSTNFYLTYYFLVTLHLIILCTAYIGGDVYIFGIAMHVCGQFELLYDELDGLDGDENHIVLREKVNRLCRRHQHLLRLAEEFEKTFNLILLIQVAASTFIISISGILLLLGVKYGDGDVIVASIIRIYMLYFQLFIYSYIGEQLTTQAEKLQVAAYNCSWYKMAPSIVRDLSFVIMRSNCQFHFTAGKILKMNIESFKDLVKTMFSYFSVVRLMFE